MPSVIPLVPTKLIFYFKQNHSLLVHLSVLLHAAAVRILRELLIGVVYFIRHLPGFGVSSFALTLFNSAIP